MTQLIIHGRQTSSNVQAVTWTAAELGLSFERLDVGGAYGGTDTAEYKSMNPMGLVPTLQDGDVILFESCAIVRYLAARYGDARFWPADPVERAKLDQWAEWAKGTFTRAVIYDVFWTLIRTPKAERNMEALAASVKNVAHLAKIIDQRIGAGPYLAGENFTFADIVVGHVLYRYYTLDFERTLTQSLIVGIQMRCRRPAFVDHSMIDYSPLKVE